MFPHVWRIVTYESFGEQAGTPLTTTQRLRPERTFSQNDCENVEKMI